MYAIRSYYAKVLSNLGVDLNKVRSAVEFIIGRGDRAGTGEIGQLSALFPVLEETSLV